MIKQCGKRLDKRSGGLLLEPGEGGHSHWGWEGSQGRLPGEALHGVLETE